jgi:hypothetical protein
MVYNIVLDVDRENGSLVLLPVTYVFFKRVILTKIVFDINFTLHSHSLAPKKGV